MANADELLQSFNDALQCETDAKIKRALELWMKCDHTYKRIVLHSSGFSGDLNGKTLRDHFDTMELLDSLDSCIEDMEYDIAANGGA